jgi:hypothetical protein
VASAWNRGSFRGWPALIESMLAFAPQTYTPLDDAVGDARNDGE